MKIFYTLCWFLLMSPFLGYIVWAFIYTWNKTHAEVIVDPKMWIGTACMIAYYFVLKKIIDKWM